MAGPAHPGVWVASLAVKPALLCCPRCWERVRLEAINAGVWHCERCGTTFEEPKVWD